MLNLSVADQKQREPLKPPNEIPLKRNGKIVKFFPKRKGKKNISTKCQTKRNKARSKQIIVSGTAITQLGARTYMNMQHGQGHAV